MLDEYQREEALIHFQRGLNLERAHRVEEAVAEYRRAIARYPHLREAHDALGFYYQRHGLMAKAAEEFRVVAALDGDFLAYFNLGFAMLELGRYDESFAAFQRCLELEPNDPVCHYELSSIYFLRGNYQAAFDELQIPLSQFPEDWEVLRLLGNCQLRLRAYDEALVSLGNALRLAPRPLAQAQVIEHICTVERYREIDVPRSLKDQLYAEHGVVYLGSAQDDGLRQEEFQDYHFTYPDIGATLQRFMALYDALEWHFTCIVPLDRQAGPLAQALTVLLNVPLRQADALEPDDLPLLILAVGREAELLKLASERVPGEALTFCLGLNWLRHNQTLPDVTGIIARGVCSVPWEPELRRLRSDRAPQIQIAACLSRAAQQIVAATQGTLLDTNLPHQVAYYTRYRNLRFADIFDIGSLINLR